MAAEWFQHPAPEVGEHDAEFHISQEDLGGGGKALIMPAAVLGGALAIGLAWARLKQLENPNYLRASSPKDSDRIHVSGFADIAIVAGRGLVGAARDAIR